MLDDHLETLCGEGSVAPCTRRTPRNIMERVAKGSSPSQCDRYEGVMLALTWMDHGEYTQETIFIFISWRLY